MAETCRANARYARMLSGSTSKKREDVTQPATALLFLTTIEVAETLRISRRTLERMRVEGTGPRYLKVGPGKRARVLYRQSEVDAWLSRFDFGSTSEYGR